MKLVDSYEARKELAVAVAKVIAAANEFESKYNLSDDRKLEMLWELGFNDLRKLEEYRDP